MLKKLLYIFSALVINVSVIHAQGNFTAPSDTIVLDTTSACQTMNILTAHLQNTSSTDTTQMSWRVIYNTFPHGWSVSYCYPGICLNSQQIGYHTFHFSLLPSDTGSMELELTPQSGTYTGYYQVLTWVTSDSANTAKTINYRSTLTTPANCASGITEAPAVNQVSLYPNPVRSDLKLSITQNLSNGQMDIYDLIGSRVYSQPISNRESVKEFDLSGLQNGIYVVRVSDGGRVIATRKFTKED